MRRILIYLVFASVAAAGCSRASATESASTGSAAGDPAGVTGAAGEKTREITLPAGTHLPIVLDTTVGSDISTIEQPVHAHLSRAVTLQGTTVLPEGSQLSGVVTDAKRSGKVKGLAHIAVRFDTLAVSGHDERYRIDTSAVGRTAQATKKKDALEIGGGAAGGALIGGLIGGKKGALIGTAAGGGAGTAVVLSTRGQEIHVPRGSAMTLRLVKPLTIRVKE